MNIKSLKTCFLIIAAIFILMPQPGQAVGESCNGGKGLCKQAGDYSCTTNRTGDPICTPGYCCDNATQPNSTGTTCNGGRGTCKQAGDYSCTTNRTGDPVCTPGYCCDNATGTPNPNPGGGSTTCPPGQNCPSTGNGVPSMGIEIPSGTGLSNVPIATLLANLLNWLIRIFLLLAVISFVVTGIQYIVAMGNTYSSAADSAKKNFTNSILAVVIVGSAYIIISTINKLLQGF